MELKTKIEALDGKHDLFITREFELPVDLLYRAFVDAEVVEQWMGTKVIKLENQKHGSYQFETTDPRGNTHCFSGAIHDVVQNAKITRTFEMANTPFGVQLEVLTFESHGDDTSRLIMHVIYESSAQRDQVMQLPFRQGINMAHNRLQDVVTKLKS